MGIWILYKNKNTYNKYKINKDMQIWNKKRKKNIYNVI